MKDNLKKFAAKYFVYFFAAGVLLLNFTLIFDNVVWGDEAFSGTVIQGTDMFGILQRIYYWDTHPPLYYLLLKVLSAVLGYHTWVFHLFSYLMYAAGVVFVLICWKKKTGWFPVALFILVGGLSATCVEYDLEIRMYALVFTEILLCCYFSYLIITQQAKKREWVLLVLFGVAAAYSHYYGLVTTGILLAVTSFGYFLIHKGKTWLYGVVSVAAYLLLYSPWLVALCRQMKVVSNGWWATSPSAFDPLMEFLFGGARMKPVLMPLTIVLSVLVIVSDLGIFEMKKVDKGQYLVAFRKKFSLKEISAQGRGILVLWGTVALVIGFAYGISAVYKPILEVRYMYPLEPLLLTILMLASDKFLKNAVEWKIKKGAYLLSGVLFTLLLIIGLMDFRYFRSVSRTQDVETGKILTWVGNAGKDTVFMADGVRHLAWSVLAYYYPESRIEAGNPLEAPKDAPEVWSFMGYLLKDDILKEMEERGYHMELRKDMWMGKYGCNLYHFYRESE